jgi:hypothetical protein
VTTLKIIPEALILSTTETEKHLISQLITSKRSESTPTQMPPAEPVAGREFQVNILLPTKELR